MYACVFVTVSDLDPHYFKTCMVNIIYLWYVDVLRPQDHVYFMLSPKDDLIIGSLWLIYLGETY